MTALAVNTCAAKLDDLAAYFGASGHARDRRADGRQRPPHRHCNAQAPPDVSCSASHEPGGGHGLLISMLLVGAAVAASAVTPLARPASARASLPLRADPKATDGPVAGPRPVPSCGPAGGRDARSEPWPPGPRGATGGTASRIASRVGMEMPQTPSGTDRETRFARHAATAAVS